MPESYILKKSSLPVYLQRILPDLYSDSSNTKQSSTDEVQVLSYVKFRARLVETANQAQSHAQLLLYRHYLTEVLLPNKLSPGLILERALTYEALGYSDLAIGDAYVALTLWESLIDESVSDLRPDLDGYNDDVVDKVVREKKYRCLLVLCRCAARIGCIDRAKIWFEMLSGLLREKDDLEDQDIAEHVEADLLDCFSISGSGTEDLRSMIDVISNGKVDGIHFGQARREIYPWNDHEPDRLGEEVIRELNNKLKQVAPKLEVRKAKLPQLEQQPLAETSDADHIDEDNNQLGLFALENLPSESIILQERSVVTGIRAHDDALCDACAADLEDIPFEQRRGCPGCDLPFCSEECYTLAMQKYHFPNEDEEENDEEGFPPESSPFCGGRSGNNDISMLARAESSDTPEWDLYFLLLSRIFQMAESQNIHPLDLFEVKYLWGDFQLPPSSNNLRLPYSIHHHVELPLQFFEILMHSRENCKPYTKHWLEKYDWWIIQTLFAKCRGVADAQLSKWTGKPEIATVHPLWCLGNHSCEPNVTWLSAGLREFVVLDEDIKMDEQIWSHYTDINELDYTVRRDRLRDVLGGTCLCPRCVREEADQRDE